MSDNKNEQLDMFEFNNPVIKGFPELRWTGKRPYTATQFFPAQLKEKYGKSDENGWFNKIFWGDNLQVMSHLLKNFRGKINLIYIDPPFDSKADYKKKIKLKGKLVQNDSSAFEAKQYGDIWTNDEYLQFMYERLIIMKELLSDTGSIFLHCDWHRAHQLRSIMDEIFGISNFRNEIIWSYSTLGRPDDRYAMKHDNILCYGKTNATFFNKEDAKIPYTDEYIKSHFRDVDENGRKCRKRFDAGKWRTYYPDEGMIPNDVWDIPYENSMSKVRTDYPTQKPEALLERIIKGSSKKGDLVFDCFMGSGTTQAVAMKLGRRFIGADINLGAVQITTNRLAAFINSCDSNENCTGFCVYNVNNYDFFKNPVEAKDLLIEALGIQKFSSSNIFDGELDGRHVKILPVNRIATKADLKELVSNLPYNAYEKVKDENPNEPVDKITLVCMGHEPDLKASLQQMIGSYKVDVEVVDILKDKSDLEFKRDAQADIILKNKEIIIRNFYPMNLLQKLSIQKENVEEWRQLVDSIMIDYNYDGNALNPQIIDIPEKNDLVKGKYTIPAEHGKIRVKITDLLSESLEVEVM